MDSDCRVAEIPLRGPELGARAPPALPARQDSSSGRSLLFPLTDRAEAGP